MIQIERMCRRNIHTFMYYALYLFKVVFHVRFLFVFCILIALVGCGDTAGTTGTANKTPASTGP